MEPICLPCPLENSNCMAAPLQEIMGHASITTTLDLYGHLYPGDMDRYADQPRRRCRAG